ncbi:ABC transporter ATP-binding protein [Flexithrix dorotheae]|uniref:ABC transporter ATP-binding protein n=1 Tax=Flexithrix dorotheae TaxID=70993 RepID=UPI0003721794|nr:ABC transporter ATP-binding protein [Flexithrix dorotheae]
MDIQLASLNKKFARDWIFNNLDFKFNQGKKYAITGNNGSGKTTLLRIIAGIDHPSSGNITYSVNGKNVSGDHIYKLLSYAGPYTELVEEFSLSELLDFYLKFKPLEIGKNEFITKTGFQGFEDKIVKNFSSGMKQKLKLGLAIFTQNNLVLLDEPTSNFDQINTNWYLDIIKKNYPEKTIIICSNQKIEYDFCDQVLNIMDFKNR